MKKTLLTLLLVGSTLLLHAQARLIAVKGKSTNTVAKNLDDAIKVAKAGDVIYLPGGVYGITDTIQKKIHIVGTGYNSQIARATRPSYINGNLIIGKQAEGTIIEGIATDNGSNLHIYADNVILRRCAIYKTIDFSKSSRYGQIINCIAYKIDGQYLTVHNSLVYSFDAAHSEISNSIIRRFKFADNNVAINTIWGENYQNRSTVHFTACYHNKNAIDYGYKGELAKIFKNSPSNDFYNLSNNYQLTDSLTNLYPNLGIYHGEYPWKDGGQPITPHIEENKSYLDVPSQLFRLNVKVKAQPK